VALHRKRLLELLKKEEILEMFKMEFGDYKYIFEYDTKEELEDYIKITMATHEQASQIRDRHTVVRHLIENEEVKPKKEGITFADLEIKFIASKKRVDKVSASTYKAYASTFKKAISFFRKTKIESIGIEDYEEFRDYLSEELEMKNKTINNHTTYINFFLDFAVTYKLISENNISGLEKLREDNFSKENFTDEDVNSVLNYNHPQVFKDIFKIGAYTGMRVSEVIGLNKESIKAHDNGIYYFDILKSKTRSGIRKVPIHKDILDDVLKMDFPLLAEKTNNASQKAILKELYNVIEKDSTKSFHTFRGTFMSKCINKFPDSIFRIREIVGHSQGEVALTIDDYAKGFELALKKEIVDSVSYKITSPSSNS
jgi:integrase